MRRLSCLIVTAALVGLPAGASAKEVTKAIVCGSDGCHSTRDRWIQRMHDVGVPISAPKKAAAYYTVRLTFSDGTQEVEGMAFRFLPTTGLLKLEDEFGEPGWTTTSPGTVRALRRLAKGLTPYSASKLDITPRKEPTAQVNEVFSPGGGAAGGSSGPTAPADDGDGFPWLVTLGGLAGAGVLAAIARALTRRRRRRRLTPSPSAG